MSEYAEIFAELAGPTRELRGAIPDVWAGFSATHQATACSSPASRSTR